MASKRLILIALLFLALDFNSIAAQFVPQQAFEDHSVSLLEQMESWTTADGRVTISFPESWTKMGADRVKEYSPMARTAIPSSRHRRRAGANGVDGADGADGAPGSPGVSGVEVLLAGYTCAADLRVNPDGVTYTLGNRCSESLACPVGKRPISGGYSLPDYHGALTPYTQLAPVVWAFASYPSASDGAWGNVAYDHWTVGVYNGSITDVLFVIFVTCADVSP